MATATLALLSGCQPGAGARGVLRQATPMPGLPGAGIQTNEPFTTSPALPSSPAVPSIPIPGPATADGGSAGALDVTQGSVGTLGILPDGGTSFRGTTVGTLDLPDGGSFSPGGVGNVPLGTGFGGSGFSLDGGSLP